MMFHPVLFAFCITVFNCSGNGNANIHDSLFVFRNILSLCDAFLLSCEELALAMLHISNVMLIALLMSCKPLAVAVLEFFAATAGTHIIASWHLVFYYRICFPVACRL